MFTAVLISFGVVFLAELGDKSQLITMTYALRHRWWVVLSGVGIAAFLVHGISVMVGHFLGLTLPARPIAFVAGLSFLAFAAWTWHEARMTANNADAAGPTASTPRFVLFAVISSFVLAELGDKTMLATVALASEQNWAGVWLGATVAMVVADAVAIVVGRLLHRRLPERMLHLMASVSFALFGLWMLFGSALGWQPVALTAMAVLAAAATIALTVTHRRGRLSDPAGEALPVVNRETLGIKLGVYPGRSDNSE